MVLLGAPPFAGPCVTILRNGLAPAATNTNDQSCCRLMAMSSAFRDFANRQDPSELVAVVASLARRIE